MKDYLNTEERKQLISILHLMSASERLLEGKTFSKSEKGNLKRGFTFTSKAIESLRDRLNDTAKEMFLKDFKKSKIYIDIYNATEEYVRKKSCDIEAAYEKNKEYYKLVELILHYNCRNCSKHCTDCEIYKEFEERSIPEFQGATNSGECKYSYEGDD